MVATPLISHCYYLLLFMYSYGGRCESCKFQELLSLKSFLSFPDSLGASLVSLKEIFQTEENVKPVRLGSHHYDLTYYGLNYFLFIGTAVSASNMILGMSRMQGIPSITSPTHFLYLKWLFPLPAAVLFPLYRSLSLHQLASRFSHCPPNVKMRVLHACFRLR